MGVAGYRLALALGVIGGGTARADDATIDWAKGLVIADGVGIADRHAPNPAVARGTSRRAAEEAAKAVIAAALPKLPLAAGGKVADKLDKPARARLERAVAAAIAIAADPETDGAWRVRMAVPIEAVRQAIVGPRAVGETGDAGPAVVIVDGVTAKPAVGWTVGGVAGATLWVKDLPDWAKDAPHVHASAAKHGAIEVDGLQAGPATLFVID